MLPNPELQRRCAVHIPSRSRTPHRTILQHALKLMLTTPVPLIPYEDTSRPVAGIHAGMHHAMAWPACAWSRATNAIQPHCRLRTCFAMRLHEAASLKPTAVAFLSVMPTVHRWGQSSITLLV